MISILYSHQKCKLIYFPMIHDPCIIYDAKVYFLSKCTFMTLGEFTPSKYVINNIQLENFTFL